LREISGWRVKNLSEEPIKMIDVSGKDTVFRTATAVGKIKLKKATVDAILSGGIKKGDPLTVGEIAAILAVKKTPELLPLCHNIPIGKVDVKYVFSEAYVEARCTVVTNAQTGVEMEALVGVTTALLNIWDMAKYLEKDDDGQYPDAVITDVRVVEKRKGK
jgi:cyclic pyranopterin phosphate synthase